MTVANTRGLSLEALESRLNLSTITAGFAPAAALGDSAGVLSPTRRYRLASLAASTQVVADAIKAAPNNPAQMFFQAAKDQQAAAPPHSPVAIPISTTPVAPPQSPLTIPITTTPVAPPQSPVTIPITTTPVAPPQSPLAIPISTTPVAPPGAHVTQGPITALDWAPPAANLTNQSAMIVIWIDGTPGTTFDNQIATWAAQSRSKPQGQSALLVTALDALMSNPLDNAKTASGALTSYLSPWLDHGTAALKAQCSYFFQKYYADGGRADYIIDDFEGNLGGLSSANVRAIQADPRSVSLTQALGPNIFTTVLANNPATMYAWNDAMTTVVSNALNTAEFNVAAQYFPNARMSNYYSYVTTQQNAVPDPSYWMPYYNTYAGNRQAPALYGFIAPRLANVILPGTTSPYTSTPFAALRLTVNTLRACALSSPAPIDPWIAGPGYTTSLDTPYYQEAIYHEALDGAETFLNWNPAAIANEAQNAMVDQTLATLNQQLGTGPRWSVTPAAMAWNSPLIVSGMQTATNVVWRITAPPGTRQIKVIETGEVLNLNGDAGVWYTSQPKQAIDFTILS